MSRLVQFDSEALYNILREIVNGANISTNVNLGDIESIVKSDTTMIDEMQQEIDNLKAKVVSLESKLSEITTGE